MAELVITLGVVALVVSLAITFYSEYKSGALLSATRGDLDVIKKAIQAWQMEHKSSYPHLDPPVKQSHDGAALVDPWGNPYRVLPHRALAYSFGPDGADDGGGGDDVCLEYVPMAYDNLRAPEEFRVSRQQEDRVTLSWKPVFVKNDVVEAYELQRRDSLRPQWGITRTVAGSSLDWTDEGLSPKKTYYYRLRARSAGKALGPWAGPVGYRIVLSSGILLELSPTTGRFLRGTPISFLVAARGSGAALRKVTFDGSEVPIEEGRVQSTLERSFDRLGTQRLVLRAEDTLGNVETAEAEIEVYEEEAE